MIFLVVKNSIENKKKITYFRNFYFLAEGVIYFIKEKITQNHS